MLLAVMEAKQIRSVLLSLTCVFLVPGFALELNADVVHELFTKRMDDVMFENRLLNIKLEEAVRMIENQAVSITNLERASKKIEKQAEKIASLEEVKNRMDNQAGSITDLEETTNKMQKQADRMASLEETVNKMQKQADRIASLEETVNKMQKQADRITNLEETVNTKENRANKRIAKLENSILNNEIAISNVTYLVTEYKMKVIKESESSLNIIQDAVMKQSTTVRKMLSAVKLSFHNKFISFKNDMKLQMSAMNTSVESQISAMNTSVESQLSAINTSLESQMSAINISVESQMSAMNILVESQMSTMNILVESQMSAMNTSIESQVSAMNTSVESQISAMNILVESQVSAMNTSVESQISAMNILVESQMSAMNILVDSQVSAMNTSVESQISAMNILVESQMSAMNILVESQMSAMNILVESQMSAMNTSIESLVTAMHTSIESQMFSFETVLTHTENTVSVTLNDYSNEIKETFFNIKQEMKTFANENERKLETLREKTDKKSNEAIDDIQQLQTRLVKVETTRQVTNGGWGAWLTWTSCTASCNGGIQTRERHCNNPKPTADGDYCDGSSSDVRMCNQQHCLRQRAAFFARFVTRQSNRMVRFSNTLLNEGSVYNSATGEFTCPYPGLYVFIANMFEDSRGDNYIFCSIRKNGSNYVTMFSLQGSIDGKFATDGYGAATGAATLYLVKGDRVHVHCPGGTNLTYSSFSGFLISTDP